MSEKSELYNQLKELGAVFEKPYVNYTVDELKDLGYALVQARSQEPVSAPDPARVAPRVAPPQNRPEAATSAQSRPSPARVAAAVADRARQGPQTLAELEQVVIQAFQNKQLQEGSRILYKNEHYIPIKHDGAERAGLTYSHPVDIPIRIDLFGRIWFMDEVMKPAIPKPRMTRKTRYIDSGVKEVKTFRGEGIIDEIYEVAGDEHRELTTTVTLPSWQVGKYKDARFPFMIHTYNGEQGFDYLEVIRYFGGRDLVPGSIKTLHVGNQLCYHIPTTRETIENQFRLLQRSH